MRTSHLHVGLTVKNLERSLAFYRDVVGMEVTRQFKSASEEFDRLTHNEGARLHLAHLRLGRFEVQLIEYLAGGSDSALELSHERCGSPHMCFRVDDVDRKFRDLQAQDDVRITSEIVNIAPGARSFYTADPDGVPVEFVGITPSGGH